LTYIILQNPMEKIKDLIMLYYKKLLQSNGII
jgi:hypothetical protein